MLYEMLTGRRAFEGEDLNDTLAAVLRVDPDFTKLPDDVNPVVRTIVKRCLEKDRKQRFGDISTAIFLLSEPAITSPPAPVAVAAPSRPRERLAWVAALVATAVLVGGAVYFLARPRVEPPAAIRFQVSPPPGTTVGAATVQSVALSPDGRRLASVVARGDGQGNVLALRSFDTLEARVLPGTEGAGTPFWSPDSRFIGFFAQGKLKKIDATGGLPQVLCDAIGALGGTWNRDGTILFAPNGTSGLSRVSSAGGTPTPLTMLDTTKQERSHRFPWFLPDGRRFLYVAQWLGAPGKIYVSSLDSPEKRELLISESKAIYADGHLLFIRDATLLAQPFDAGALRITGESFPIAEEVSFNVANAGASVSASTTGVLAYRTGAASEPSQLVWFDRSGKQLGTVGERVDQLNVMLSPDGQRVAVSVLDSARNSRDIALYDLARGGLRTRFTFDAADEFSVIWSPDGGRLAFNSSRKGQLDVFQKASSGVGADVLLLDDSATNIYPTSWSTDGLFILYHNGNVNSATGNDVWVLPLTGDKKPLPLVQSTFNETGARFSPDGRWIAYQSNESGGGNEVFVIPFSASGQTTGGTLAPGGKWQVSTAGGTSPRWRHDGKELFFISADNKLMAADVNGQGAAFQVGTVRPLFEIRRRLAGWLGSGLNYGAGVNYDVAADGQRFLVNTVTEQTTSTPITVVVNWTAGLRK